MYINTQRQCRICLLPLLLLPKVTVMVMTNCEVDFIPAMGYRNQLVYVGLCNSDFVAYLRLRLEYSTQHHILLLHAEKAITLKLRHK